MIQLNLLNKPLREFATSPYGINMSDLEAKLPEPIRRLLTPIEDANEYLTVLVTTLTVTGGIMPEIWSTYDRRKIYAMMMLFVVCPPAGGKGMVSLSGKLLERINQHLSKEHKTAMTHYQREVDLYRMSLKAGTTRPLTQEPRQPLLMGPGNITNSKLIQQLADNVTMPLVIIETEADVLGGAFRSDHGLLLSTTLRQAYHHEKVSFSRKTNNELMEVPCPKLVTVLAGTDNQITSIFKSNQDGLYSRFLFLRNLTSLEWHSVKPGLGTVSLDSHYNVWSEWFFKVWQQTQTFDAEVTFSDKQWDRLNEFGKECQGVALLVGGEYSVSIARRHALMVIRMAMTLSFLHRVDSDTAAVDTTVRRWVCDDPDFETALTIVKMSFKYSLEIFNMMPQPQQARFNNGKRMAFLQALPEHFDMKLANSISQALGIPDRTKSRWLNELCATDTLEHVDRGEYRKTAVALMALMAAEA